MSGDQSQEVSCSREALSRALLARSNNNLVGNNSILETLLSALAHLVNARREEKATQTGLSDDENRSFRENKHRLLFRLDYISEPLFQGDLR